MDFKASMEWTSISTQSNGHSKHSKSEIFVQQRSSFWKYFMFFSLCYGNFWASACVSLQAPFFPEKAEQKGVSPTIYGLIFGIYELAILTTAPIFGKLVGKVSPKYLINSGLFLVGSSNMLFGLLDLVSDRIDFIILAFAIRIVEGIGAAAFLTASYTLMASEFPDKVALYFALLETFFGLGLILGPTVGGILYQLGDYRLPFMVAGVFMITGSILGIFAIHQTNSFSETKSGQWGNFLRDYGLLIDILCIISALNFIGFNCATLEPHLRIYELSPSMTGSVFVITGSLYAFTSPIWGKIIEKDVDPKNICAFGALVSCIGLVFIGPLPNLFQTELWLIILSLVFIGIGVAAKLVAGFMDAINDAVNRRKFPNDSSTYGMCSAMYFCCSSIGAFTGPSIGGALTDKFGYRNATIFLFAFELLLFIALIVPIARRQFVRIDQCSEVNERRPLLVRRNSELAASCRVTHL